MNRFRTQYLIAFLLIVLVVVGAVYGIQPLKSRDEALKTQKTDLSLRNEQLKAEVVTLEAAKKELEGLTEVRKAELFGAIPLKLAQDQLLTDLNRLGKDHNMSLQNVSFGLGEAVSGLKKVTMNANFIGIYADLVEFLKALEENPRKMVVRSISVQVSKGEKSPASVNFSLQVEAFYQS